MGPVGIRIDSICRIDSVAADFRCRFLEIHIEPENYHEQRTWGMIRIALR